MIQLKSFTPQFGAAFRINNPTWAPLNDAQKSDLLVSLMKTAIPQRTTVDFSPYHYALYDTMAGGGNGTIVYTGDDAMAYQALKPQIDNALEQYKANLQNGNAALNDTLIDKESPLGKFLAKYHSVTSSFTKVFSFDKFLNDLKTKNVDLKTGEIN
ncbi:MAG: hypothetical protein K2X66_16105 [Cyanobacteria bacterium]|nr:hypothetical protein [Cyanobacteriota bacterium]